ncbi:MAG: hypothetical protein M0005_17690 [Actinomycetota bacterium]|nr:hypothetical protein [Actinomycetota bacterium]
MTTLFDRDTLSSSSSYVVEWQLRDQGDAGTASSQSGRPEASADFGLARVEERDCAP